MTELSLYGLSPNPSSGTLLPISFTPLPLELHGALSMILVLPLRELASCRYLASPTVSQHSHRSVESKSTYVRRFDSCLILSTVAASGIQSSLIPNLRSRFLRCSSHPHGSTYVTPDKSTKRAPTNGFSQHGICSGSPYRPPTSDCSCSYANCTQTS